MITTEACQILQHPLSSGYSCNATATPLRLHRCSTTFVRLSSDAHSTHSSRTHSGRVASQSRRSFNRRNRRDEIWATTWAKPMRPHSKFSRRARAPRRPRLTRSPRRTWGCCCCCCCTAHLDEKRISCLRRSTRSISLPDGGGAAVVGVWPARRCRPYFASVSLNIDGALRPRESLLSVHFTLTHTDTHRRQRYTNGAR